jgi:hypothetical protein
MRFSERLQVPTEGQEMASGAVIKTLWRQVAKNFTTFSRLYQFIFQTFDTLKNSSINLFYGKLSNSGGLR